VTQPTPAFPADVEAVLDQLAANTAAARRLGGELSEAQLTWQPAPGKSWSVAQCLQHLARTSGPYCAAMRAALREAAAHRAPLRQGPYRPGLLVRQFLKSLEPPVNLKLPAPDEIQPAARPAGARALDEFLRSQEEVCAVVREAAPFDWNRVEFPNPFLRLFSLAFGAGPAIIAAHNRRHLWQAEQLRRLPGFPPA
jgi:hypothetical protein